MGKDCVAFSSIPKYSVLALLTLEVDWSQRSGYMKHTLLKEVFFYYAFA